MRKRCLIWILCLVGIDASAPVLKKIQEGTVIRGSVSQDTKGFAEVTIHAAIAAIQGNPLLQWKT